MAKFKYHGIVGAHIPIYGPKAGTVAALFCDTKADGKRPGRYLLVTLDEYEISQEIPEVHKRVFRGQRIPAMALLEASADLTLARIDIVAGEQKVYEGFPFPHLPIVSSLDPAKRGLIVNDQLAKIAQSQKAKEKKRPIGDGEDNEPRFEFAEPVLGDVVRDQKTDREVVGLFQLCDDESNVLGQVVLTMNNMLVMLPLVEEAEKNGKTCDFPSGELIAGVKQVTAKKKLVENRPALIGTLSHWPKPIHANIDISLSPG